MIVGPERCRHCTRAIYPNSSGWIHGNGNPVCYTPAGNPLPAEPRQEKSK